MNLDLNSIAKTLLGSASSKGIAQQTGVSSKQVTEVLTSALPLLLEGAGKQSTGKSTAASFAEALASHATSDTKNLSSFLSNVDLEDGAKIVNHLLGKGKNTTAKKISKESGIDTETVIKILAAAAPLLMSLLGKKATSNAKTNKKQSTASIASAILENVDVGGLIGSFLKK